MFGNKKRIQYLERELFKLRHRVVDLESEQDIYLTSVGGRSKARTVKETLYLILNHFGLKYKDTPPSSELVVVVEKAKKK